MNEPITRRRFMQATASVAAGGIGFPLVVPSTVRAARGRTPPSEKIVMACIGVGSMGGGHLRAFLGFEDVRMVAACDLRKVFRDKAKERIDRHYGNDDAATYGDFRELLARDDIDAVCIATPDHWHALIGIEAARQGKSMYLEKPVDVHVAAARALRQAVHRYGVVFQFGTQQRSGRDFRFACELVRNQRIGKLQTIVVGSLPSITFPNRKSEPQPDPEEFDYDTWLGPAPWVPYGYDRCASRAQGHEGAWTHIYDYSLGGLSGAWGIHHVDIAQWANATDDTGPIEIEGTGALPKDGLSDTPIAWRVEHRYANGVKMIHASTAQTLREFEQFENKTLLHRGCGILCIGSDGWVIVSRNGVDAHPKSLLKSVIGSEESRLPVSNNHRRNFLDCVKTRQETICPTDSAVRSDTICHLDDIAIRLGRKLRWDPRRERFINDDQANRMLSRPCRSPWRL